MCYGEIHARNCSGLKSIQRLRNYGSTGRAGADVAEQRGTALGTAGIVQYGTSVHTTAPVGG